MQSVAAVQTQITQRMHVCCCSLLATVPPKQVEQAQQLLDEVKAIFADPPKNDKDVQALKQLIPA
jgi:hypothetical protein